VTLRFEFMATVQLDDVPEHAPDHPAKIELAPGVAVRVTDVPALKIVPVGLLVTVPLPEPLVEMLSEYVCTPAWLIVKVRPAMVRPAMRAAVPVLAATE
jgi:hypothetical protein